jgi:uncharacterized membrane protein
MIESVAGDVGAFAYFLAMWVGYVVYAKHRAKRGTLLSLSRGMRAHRELWAARMLDRDVRIMDATLLANQERVSGFFASTTLILLAAVLTAISNASQIAEISGHLPLASGSSKTELEYKLFILLLIMVYAFFKVTWSLRQYGFANVLFGSAPSEAEPVSDEARHRFVSNLARLMDKAGHDNNDCLRAYYFAVAIVFWVAGNVAFVVATTAIVLILAEREFRSPAVACIVDSQVPLATDDDRV